MQNRFGIKDFLLLVLVGAVLVSVWLSMSASSVASSSSGSLKPSRAKIFTPLSSKGL